MSAVFDAASLADIKARALPRCDFADLFTVATDNPDAVEVKAKCAAYLLGFLSPRKECVCCGWTLGGVLGSFRWGIAHGEGECGRCGYPARAVHCIDDVVSFRGLILQYHPDDLSFAARDDVEAAS